MLAGGRLVVTVTSKATHQHVTLRMRCTVKDDHGKWPTVPYAEASRIYIEDYDSALIAVYYTFDGDVFWEPRATPAARWTVRHLLRYLAGAYPALRAVAYIDAAALCGRCGDELTDPQSIERGFGPVCWGAATQSRSVAVMA